MGLEIQYGGQNVRAASSYLQPWLQLTSRPKNRTYWWNISILKILPFTIFTLLYPQLEKLFIKERFWNVYLLSVLKSKIHAWSVEIADINGIITRFQRNTEHTKLLHQEMWKKWLQRNKIIEKGWETSIIYYTLAKCITTGIEENNKL